MRKISRRTFHAAALATASTTALAACGSGGSDSDSAQLEFFQSKTESVEIVNELIADFQAANPGITVVQKNTPDALTTLKADLAKGNIPDVIGINTTMYNDIAATGILAEQVETEAAKAVSNTAAVEYIDAAGQTDTTYAVPWTVNAQVVLYDIDQFEQLGLSVPETWDDFIATATAIRDAGSQPFAFTWKDNWTAKLLLNSLAGPTQGADFWQQLQAGTATFAGSEAYRDAAARLLELKGFASGDPFGATYDDGNANFASGDSVLYIQGTWAIPEIAKVSPDKRIGAFALPTADSPDGNLLLSGPDSVLGVTKDGENPEAAQKFVDFLLSAEAQASYSKDQHLLSVRDDVAPADEALAALKETWLDTGRTAMYPDSMFTGASDLGAIVQTFLYDEDTEKFLAALDSDFAAAGIK